MYSFESACNALLIKELTQLKLTCTHAWQLNLFQCIMQSPATHVSQLQYMSGTTGLGDSALDLIMIQHADMFCSHITTGETAPQQGKDLVSL